MVPSYPPPAGPGWHQQPLPMVSNGILVSSPGQAQPDATATQWYPMVSSYLCHGWGGTSRHPMVFNGIHLSSSGRAGSCCHPVVSNSILASAPVGRTSTSKGPALVAETGEAGERWPQARPNPCCLPHPSNPDDGPCNANNETAE